MCIFPFAFQFFLCYGNVGVQGTIRFLVHRHKKKCIEIIGGISLKQKEQFQVYFHHLMALSGGFMGAYALLSRLEVFGSSQTANMITIVSHLVGHNYFDVFIRVMALLIYAAGIAFTILIPRLTPLKNLHVLSILFDIAALSVTGFIPDTVNPVVALYPFFFATAFQWCSFGSVKGYNSSTIFSTNNLRQTVSAFTQYCCDHDPKNLDKAKYFGGTLLFFHTGVIISCLAYMKWHVAGAWAGIIPLCLALCLGIYELVDGIQAQKLCRVQHS